MYGIRENTPPTRFKRMFFNNSFSIPSTRSDFRPVINLILRLATGGEAIEILTNYK